MIQFLQKHQDKFIKLLWVGVVLVSLKSILTDTGFDNAYTVAMSYRHLGGDGMFAQMWEPHQTSIFFTDILLWLYHIVVPSYTGVMLYLQVCGTLLFAVLCIPLYRLMKDCAGKNVAQLACMFFLVFRAKQTPFPDFANLQIACSVVVFLFLVKFLREQQKTGYLCLAAAGLCLEVLAYPSCLIVYAPVVLLLWIKTEKKWKNIGIFTGVCAGIGGAYVLYFVFRLGLDGLITNIGNIFYSDSHSDDYISLYSYFYGVVVGLIWIGVCGVLALAVQKTVMYFRAKSAKAAKDLQNGPEFLPLLGLFMCLVELVMLLAQKKTGVDWTCVFYILPTFLMVLGCLGYKYLSDNEKIIWITGMLLSIASFGATWLLTDLGLITIISYMVLGGVVSFLPIRHLKQEAMVFLLAICAIVVIHRGLVVWGYANKSGIWMVTEVAQDVLGGGGNTNIVRSGPSMGIVMDYMGFRQIMDDEADHNNVVTKDDKFLLVGSWIIDSMEFLLTDAQISNYSTIDTPIYNERMLDYFRLYPEKMPTVVAVSCWFGEMQVDPESWVVKWVEENYETVGDGRYWRYYRKK